MTNGTYKNQNNIFGTKSESKPGARITKIELLLHKWRINCSKQINESSLSSG